jgi:hypothetical protein
MAKLGSKEKPAVVHLKPKTALVKPDRSSLPQPPDRQTVYIIRLVEPLYND